MPSPLREGALAKWRGSKARTPPTSTLSVKRPLSRDRGLLDELLAPELETQARPRSRSPSLEPVTETVINEFLEARHGQAQALNTPGGTGHRKIPTMS